VLLTKKKEDISHEHRKKIPQVFDVPQRKDVMEASRPEGVQTADHSENTPQRQRQVLRPYLQRI